MKKYLFLVSALIFVQLSGCSTATKTGSLSAPASLGEIQSAYLIGISDQLVVNVWRNEELSLAVPVRPDGKISMPLVGDVDAAGLTPSELSQALSDRLVNFIRNPQVTVIVSDAVSSEYLRRVRVTGAVESPLSVPHRAGMTALDMVLEAGGITEFAIPNKAVLYRKTDSGVLAYAVKLGDILYKGDLSTNYILAPSDIVTVPERLF